LTARNISGGTIWTSPVDLGAGTGSPVLGHGIIVVPGLEGTIEGIRASDGASLWSHPVGLPLLDMVAGRRRFRGSLGTPVITDSVVYAGSLDGYLYALDLGDGTPLWSWFFGTPVASSPAPSGNMLFVGASDGHLYGFVSTVPSASGVDARDDGASRFRFSPPRPNPSGGEVRFRWGQPADGTVSLGIYDVTGRLVRNLARGHYEAGEHSVLWDGRDGAGRLTSSGLYLARLTIGDRTKTRKVVRLRR
jgi:hypothetical protein